MSDAKSQILANLGKEFAKTALTKQTAEGTTETNWTPIIIGGVVLYFCCVSLSVLIGWLINKLRKCNAAPEPFDPAYPSDDDSLDDRRGSNEIRNLMILAVLGLLFLYVYGNGSNKR